MGTLDIVYIQSEKMAKRKIGLKILLIVIVVVFSAGAFFILTSLDKGGTSEAVSSVYEVSEGDLEIKVIENGTVKAQDAVEIKSEVEGRTTIISIVPEGVYITEQDVKDGKILVELDSSDIKERLTRQEMDHNSAEASYKEALEALSIQKNENDSKEQQAKLDVTFKLMDLQKYIGESLAEEFLSGLKDREIGEFDMRGYLDDPNQLGGEARQRLNELTAEINLAEEKYNRAKSNYDWSMKLAKKKYIAQLELEGDRLEAETLKIKVGQAKTQLDLFRKYEFLKEAQKRLSDYREALMSLERTKARCRSELSQREAKLKSMKSRFELETEQLDKVRHQLEACIIRSPSPGMVVYSSRNSRWGGNRTNIEPGAEIRQRQEIMTLPNSNKMAVELKVHETNVDKVEAGQSASIFSDALPDKSFEGEVLKIAPMPDPQNWLTNPDSKVYNTEVAITNSDSSLRPGMSAKVEIHVDYFEDILKVPVQSVTNRGGRKVVYVKGIGVAEEREVVTGSFNNNFVEIVEGLSRGEKVLLSPPRLIEESVDKNKPKVKKSLASKGKSG